MNAACTYVLHRFVEPAVDKRFRCQRDFSVLYLGFQEVTDINTDLFSQTGRQRYLEPALDSNYIHDGC